MNGSADVNARSSPADGPEVVLVRYGELALKGHNRGEFEAALARNVKVACEPIAPVRVRREHGRMLVKAESRLGAVAERLTRVFGISSVSPAWGAANDKDEIARVARLVLDDAFAAVPPGTKVPFRVESKRADKTFPLSSPELDRHVAVTALREDDPIRVELSKPELVLGIEVRRERTFLFARRLPGPGGLPVGTLGRAVSLISGGFDSPVAAWMAMKRGCTVVYVTFHSDPFIGEGAKRKVVELVRVLSEWQPASRLYVVPFAAIQLAIKGLGEEGYRTVLYRRMMHRIATRIAGREHAGALVTGECLGQVASQTLENLTCIGAATSLPILRPLICFDKQQTIDLAHRLGTYEISAVQEPDCCTLFMPARPVIRGKLAMCESLETGLDLEALVADALARAEVVGVATAGAPAG